MCTGKYGFVLVELLKSVRNEDHASSVIALVLVKVYKLKRKIMANPNKNQSKQQQITISRISACLRHSTHRASNVCVPLGRMSR